MTCIGNSGELHDTVSEAINKEDIVASAVLSGPLAKILKEITSSLEIFGLLEMRFKRSHSQ